MNVVIGGVCHRLPDFLIIGAARSGTTGLYYDLAEHPDLFLPEVKEPFFFSFLGEPPDAFDPVFAANKRWSMKEYAALFAPAEEHQRVGEASTSYLYTWQATIANLKQIYGEKARELRIVAVLRNPIGRTFSHWQTLVRNGVDDLDFDQYLDSKFTRERGRKRWDYDWLGFGSYSAGLRAFFAAFPHVKVLLNEDLGDRHRVLHELFTFLGVDPVRTQPSDRVVNAGGIPRLAITRWLFLPSPIQRILRPIVSDGMRRRLSDWRWRLLRQSLAHPTLTERQRGLLVEAFRSDIEEVAEILGRDLSSWLEPSSRFAEVSQRT